MEKQELFYRISLTNFILMIAVLALANWIYPEANGLFLKSFGLLLSLLFVIPATYIWLDAFSRFKPTIGHYSGKWLAYVTLNLLAGLYLHHVYKNHETQTNYQPHMDSQTLRKETP